MQKQNKCLYLYQQNEIITQKTHKMTTLAKFTTSKGNDIEIYKTSKGCIVSDKSCQFEREYILGEETFLNWEQLENGYKKVRTISQVINAWKNEEIHF